MSCPFLVRMGRLTGNTKYYDEVVSQLKHYFELMFLEDKGVFAHIYWVNEKRNNVVPWGRGNGWVYLSFAEVLENLPENYPGKDELEKLFVKAVEGLVKYQAQSGRWRQVLTMEASYEETSCTAIFCMALENGKIIVMYTGHAAMPVLRYRITEKPYDIYSFGSEHTLEYDGDITYAQIFENTKKVNCGCLPV